MTKQEIFDIASRFALDSAPRTAVPFGDGHINDTFRVTCESGTRYILQRINRRVFRDPETLMANTDSVTRHLKCKITARGGDPLRETLTVIPAGDGRLLTYDRDGEPWRMTLYIENSITLRTAQDETSFHLCGAAFGDFHRMLGDYPAKTLTASIPGFHDTPAYFRTFCDAARQDPVKRLASAEREVVTLQDRAYLATCLTDWRQAGRLPLRVIHGDSKLDNLLFDRDTGTLLCVIDLDTVMPGFPAMDFGDAIRTGAVTAAEDEPDLSRYRFMPSLYEAFYTGYTGACGDLLSEQEIASLPYGALVIAYEQALRFLTDYLLGDVYYKIDRPDHNLIRTRTQIKLLDGLLDYLGESI